MRILVTGAAGFIGRHLVKELSEDHSLYCLLRREHQLADEFSCSVIKCDLSLPLDPRQLPKQLDIIVHLARAKVLFPTHADEMFRVNTVSTQALLAYGRERGIQAFIYASSGAVYGFKPTPCQEDDVPNPMNFYAVTKYCSELLVRSYREHFSTCILRLFFPYGENQREGLMPRLIKCIRERSPVTLRNGGRPRINPIYVGDVISIMRKGVELDGNHTVNIAGEEVLTIRELSALIGDLVGEEPIFKRVRDDVTLDIFGDNSRMHRMFDLEAMTGLREGLRRMIVEHAD